MYMGRLVKSLVLCLAAALALLALCSAKRSLEPRFVIQETLTRDQGIAAQADWRSERQFSGIGWKIGAVSRGDGSVMEGGYTVIHPGTRFNSKPKDEVKGKSKDKDKAKDKGKDKRQPGEPIVLPKCMTLAAFDLLPRGYLLVVIRDPATYWQNYERDQGVTDIPELVWFDENWNEESSIALDYAAGEFPDQFVLSPDQRNLLAIRHPVNDDGKPVPEGHSLNTIYLRDGSINDLALPEAAGDGQLPERWQPVRMQWNDRGDLVVQAGKELRIYELKWE
jgi:hypothetical protein